MLMSFPAMKSDPPTILTEERMKQRLLENNLKTFYRLREELKDHITH